MPLRDSFLQPDSNSNALSSLKTDKLRRAPKKEDIDFTLQRAQNNPGVPLGLQWNHKDTTLIISVTADAANAPPSWVLLSANGNDRDVIWSYKTHDMAHIMAAIESTVENPEILEQANQHAPSPRLDTAFQSTKEDIEIGSLFANQYEILSEIGEGGMGMVYKAQDTTMGDLVAIKILHRPLLNEPVSKKRFEFEARAAMSLDHPNLISVYHYGFFASSLPFLVMDFVDGYGLDEELSKQKQLSIDSFKDIFLQCCDGLHHAHRKGIIHRDLKPGNVMILRNTHPLQIKIVDFGISKVLIKDARQDLTQEGQLIGSPYYMSPEQCKGEVLDARSDIYALGCLMYQALTGVVPLAGENALQTMGKHIQESPQPLAAVRPDLHFPTELQNCIFKTLEKEPANRYSSLLELRQDLAKILGEEEPVVIQPVVEPIGTHLLVEVGDLPQSTYEAAVNVQRLLRQGMMTLNEAAETLGRVHLHGGIINAGDISEHAPGESKGIETPVEAILVEAGLMKNNVWKTVLALQQQIRLGKITKDEAIEEFRAQHPRPTVAPPAKPTMPIPQNMPELLISAGLATAADFGDAKDLSGEEGTNLAKNLVSQGKLESQTLIAARQCLSLIERKRLPPEKAIIALLYCQRSRVDLYQAFDDLGWERP